MPLITHYLLKNLLTILLTIVASVGLLLVLTSTLTIPEQVLASSQASTKITTGHFKDEPVEITKIMLDGRELKPNDTIVADAQWPSRLRITAKNVSSSPVSWIDVIAFTPPATPRGEAPFNTSYTFGARGTSSPLLQPNESVTLTADEAFGAIVPNEPVKILLQHVIWNNDPLVMWSAGKVLRFDPATRSYKPAV